MKQITSLRGLAIILIILFHLNPEHFPYGYFGVEVFLVISGYLLMKSLQKQQMQIRLGEFARKKVLRLFTPVAVIVPLTLLAGMFFLDYTDLATASSTGGYTLIGAANRFLAVIQSDYFAQDSSGNPFLHMWYLAVTAQIYLLFAGGCVLYRYLPKRAAASLFWIAGIVNMDQECPHWDFEQVRTEALSVWNEWLGKIDVKGGTNQQKMKFYTDLWHVLLGRHKIDDIDGSYPDYLKGGTRVGKATRIHTLSPEYKSRMLPKGKDGKVIHHMYNSDALWLTQWNLNTLWGLAYPSVLDEFSASFLEYDRNGGLLPRGPSVGAYTYIMTGCPATSMITSAYQRGIYRKWNPEKAFQAMKRNHEKGGMLAFDMDRELDFYVKHGYCPNDAGLTIQWAFEDWSLGQMALKMKKQREAKYFQKRSMGWKVSFHPELKLMIPRSENGDRLHTDPLSEKGFVQANAWQATFGLSHDIQGLARMMGGKDSLAVRLDEAFRKSAADDFLFSYVSYANQPGCSSAHVFSHVGYPWLTQYWVRQVGKQTYGAITPEKGYTGNDEDQGQMAGVSALMAIGLFSLDGGSSSHPCYDITSPVFDEITIKLDSDYYAGKEFKIVTHHNSEVNCYIQKATLNGKAYNFYQLLHPDFVHGGILELWMGSAPNKNWGKSMSEK